MKVSVMIEATGPVSYGQGLYVRIDGAEGVHRATWLENEKNTYQQPVTVRDALNWATEQLLEADLKPETFQYNAMTGEFEAEVTWVGKTVKMSEIVAALQPLLGDKVRDACNIDIFPETVRIHTVRGLSERPVEDDR